jgi:hypothetical protein
MFRIASLAAHEAPPDGSLGWHCRPPRLMGRSDTHSNPFQPCPLRDMQPGGIDERVVVLQTPGGWDTQPSAASYSAPAPSYSAPAVRCAPRTPKDRAGPACAMATAVCVRGLPRRDSSAAPQFASTDRALCALQPSYSAPSYAAPPSPRPGSPIRGAGDKRRAKMAEMINPSGVAAPAYSAPASSGGWNSAPAPAQGGVRQGIDKVRTGFALPSLPTKRLQVHTLIGLPSRPPLKDWVAAGTHCIQPGSVSHCATCSCPGGL